MTRPWQCLARAALWLFCLGVVCAVGAEWFSRTGLGLGTPPLYEADPGFEYRLRPHQDVMRFGNRVQVNRWGMRSPDFDARKTRPGELRVMVFGDSVVNGGSQIDQHELSTTLLQTQLQRRLNLPVTVGNASAGSWGPGNWLAYAERFGFFDADVVVLVVGSGDHSDNPVFAPLTANQPLTKPTLALQEAVQRYLPRLLLEPPRDLLTAPVETATPIGNLDPENSARGLSDVQRFLRMAQGGGRTVLVVHHPDRRELTSGTYLDGQGQVRQIVESLSLPFIELRDVYKSVGPGIYRDDIHHSVQGQAVMASALFNAVLPALETAAGAAVAATGPGVPP